MGSMVFTHLRSNSVPVGLYQWALLDGGAVEDNDAVGPRAAPVIITLLVRASY